METGNTGVVAYSGEHMPRHIDFWYDVNATDTCIFYDFLYVFPGIETTVQRISPNTPQFGLRNLEVWIVLAFGHLHTTAVMCVKCQAPRSVNNGYCLILIRQHETKGRPSNWRQVIVVCLPLRLSSYLSRQTRLFHFGSLEV